MKLPRLLSISVGVNALLLLAVCVQTYRLHQREVISGRTVAAVLRGNDALPPEPFQQPSGRLNPTLSSSGSTQPAFDWQQLESTNYQTYINNLRAVGCPEQTVRDIVSADMNATFGARRAEVMATRFHDYKFWETGVSPDKVTAELKRQKDSVDAEMEHALRELFGPDAVPPGTTSEWHVSEFSQQLSFLPADKQNAALALLLRNEANDALIKRLSEAQRPTENPDELNRVLQTYEEKHAALARLLSPEEFEQLELTVSWTAANLRRGMAKFDPTEAEFREIFRAWRSHDENLARLYATGEPDPGNSHVFAKIREALGEERYQQYRASWWK